MDYLSAGASPPRHEIYDLKTPAKISSPLENLFDPVDSSGKYLYVEPSAAPSTVPDRVENGHADPCAPAQSVEYQASDSDEKRLLGSESILVPPTDVFASVDKVDQLVDQEPVEASTAAAKASKFEDVLESPAAPEAIDQRDREESDLLDSGKRDFEELAPIADRGFEPSPRSALEAIDPIVPSEGGNAPDQQDQQEVSTEAAEIRPMTKCLVDDAVSTTTSDVTDHAPLELEARLDRSASTELFENNEPLDAAHEEAESTTEVQARSLDPIDHVPEQTVEAPSEPSPSVAAAEEVEAATSVTEQHEGKDRIESRTDAIAPEGLTVEGDDGSKCHDHVVDELSVPETTPEVDKDEAAVQDQIIPVAETAEDSASCKADDPKTEADELIEPFASQSIESERSYRADDGGKEESATRENIVDERSCGIDGPAPASDDQTMEEFAEIERSAPAEQNVAETRCKRSYQADDNGKEESAAKENIVDERSCGIDGSAPASDDHTKEEFAEIERSTPAEQYVTETPCESNDDDKKKEDHEVIQPSASQTLVEEVNYPLSDDVVKEVAVEESPAADKVNERSYGTPAASDDQPKAEFAQRDQKPASVEEKASETSYSIESTPAVSVDDHTKEDDAGIEPPPSRTVEAERSYQLADESGKEDAVEDAPAAEKDDARSCEMESTLATHDPKTNEFVELEKSAPTEESVSETRYNIDESTPAAVSDADQKKEDDEVVEPSTPQILEVDKCSHPDEPAKEDAVEETPALAPAHDATERNCNIESISAASDVQRMEVDFAPKLEISSPVEENIGETSLHDIESTSAATNEDDRKKEVFTEPEKLSSPATEHASDQRSYGIKSATDPATCDDQRVDAEESKDQKTEFEAPEDEIKSELVNPHSPAPQSVDHRSYYEAAPDSKGLILNVEDDAQTVTDPSSSPASKAGEGIELSHKIPDCAASAQPPQTGCEDSTTTVKEKPDFAAADKETQHVSEDDGASREEEHAGTEPHHKAGFLGKLIDKVTGKNK